MRAHEIEPTLSWPTDGRSRADRKNSADTAQVDHGWSSQEVARDPQPLSRVAALLLSISQNNRYEGRDPTCVPEALTSGFVADLLGVDIATLAALIVDLRRRGLVECGANSTLRLKDVDGLEQLVH